MLELVMDDYRKSFAMTEREKQFLVALKRRVDPLKPIAETVSKKEKNLKRW